MGEDILGRPAGKIEPRPVGQEAEAGRRELPAAFPHQHRVELLLEGMQMQHVGGGIGDLRLGERLRAPIRELLLLGNIDAETRGRGP